MIIHESWAVCEGCGHREQLGEPAAHPTAWPALIDEHGEHRYCSHTCVAQALAGAQRPAKQSYPLGLTPKEVRTLELLAMGKSNKEIGVSTGRAVQTIKNRIGVIFLKLGAADRLQAVLRAHAIGVINVNKLSRQIVPLYDKEDLAA